MKYLKNILKESIFDDNIDIYKSIKDEIKKFIESNYTCNRDINISDKPNRNGLYEVSTDGSVIVNDKNISSLTNNLFEWVNIRGNFSCVNCQNLKSFEGGPKRIGTDFNCINCNNIKTLENAPEYVSGDFYCIECENLKSIKGAPKYVGNNFYCMKCELNFAEIDIKAISNVKKI